MSRVIDLTERRHPDSCSTAATCIVTGATSGIGYEIALGLARRGKRVLGVGRDPLRCRDAAVRIRSASGNDAVEFETADLARPDQIDSLADRIAANQGPIGVLVNNAGTFSLSRRFTSDGIELQFGVNYLAGFRLVARLFPRLHARARVISISSGSHLSGRIHWRNLKLRPFYNGLTAYAQSKLAEVIFSYELARRIDGRNGIATFAIDPGLVNTEIGFKGGGPLVRAIWGLRARRGISAAESAAPIVNLAVSEEVAGATGRYWHNGQAVPSSRRSYDLAAGSRLWQLSERLCGLSFSGVPA